MRFWVFPGEVPDHQLVLEAKSELKRWRLDQCVWVMDRKRALDEDGRVRLQRQGGRFVIGQRLRKAAAAMREAVARAARYRRPHGHSQLRVLESFDGEVPRSWVVMRDPEQAVRDRRDRRALLAMLREGLRRVNERDHRPVSPTEQGLKPHPLYAHYVREAANGKLSIDRARV